MPTLILSPRQTEDSQRLWKAAGQLGWQVERLSSWNIPESFKSITDPVLYVEALMAPTLAESLGISLDEPPDDWLPGLPFEYRQRAISLTTLALARRCDEPKFVKPPNDKSFKAGVYRGSELPIEFPDDMPVLQSEVVAWEKEFRCFILDQQVQTFSIYLRQNQLQRAFDFASTEEEDKQVNAFAMTVLADLRVEMPDACVVDIGFIAGRGWAVVEQNAPWGSGIYGCDPAQALKVIQRASRGSNR